MYYHRPSDPPTSEEYYAPYLGARVERVLSPKKALNAVSLCMKHVVDECPSKRNVIFEIDADVSEDALIKVVQKLSSKFARIDVVTADDELLELVVLRLKKDLEPTTVDERNGATTMTATWRDEHNRDKRHDYSLTIGTISYFMRAEFVRDVTKPDEREWKNGFDVEAMKQNRVVVLYRTETMLDGRGILESHPVDTVELPVAALLCKVYEMILLNVLDDGEMLQQLQEFIKRYTDPFVYRFLKDHLPDLITSAKMANNLVEGTHFALVQTDGKNEMFVLSSIGRKHIAIRQFLQIHHSLPVTPLRVHTLKRSPLHFLKAYPRIMGVFRRGGYGLREWVPFLTQLDVYPSRVYPTDNPVTPLFCIPPSATISEWIVEVEKLMGLTRKIPQEGLRLIVCPSMDALNQLWRYLKYSHNEIVALTKVWLGTGTYHQLEESVKGRDGSQKYGVTTVLTTPAHFETWHSRFLGSMDVITVYLGTPSKEIQYLRRAYRFARPVMNVVTVPLELPDRERKDSGFESDSDDTGLEEMRKMVAYAISKVDNPSHWAKIFMTEMWERDDWKKPLSCAEDAEYEKCVQWMRRKWKEEVNESVKAKVEEWIEKMMEQYRREETH